MKISPTVRASLELLGVEPGVSTADLKKAYHRLALIYHPDRNESERAIGEFRKITEAYELLSDRLRVEELNKRYLRERLHRPVIEGIQITFGTFFGYRIFNPQVGKNPEPVHRLTGQKTSQKTGQKTDQPAGQALQDPLAEEPEVWGPIEENNSILDHAAFDAIETAYAGKMSDGDEEALKGQVGGTELARLPWVVLNNQGLLRFLEGDPKGAQKRYRELCERVPNNIIFTYRLGLCMILEGFQQPKRTLLGVLKPDRLKIDKGLKLLEHCLKLGTSRPVGRQKCLVIHKTIADVLEKIGRERAARKIWKDVLYEDPRCAEAVVKVKGIDEARRLLRDKQRSESVQVALRQLAAGQSSKGSTPGSES